MRELLEWAAFALLCLMVFALPRGIPALWRNRTRSFDTNQLVALGRDDISWRGYRRGMTVAALGGVAMLPGAAIVLIFDDSEGPPWTTTVLLISFGLLISCAVLSFFASEFARPKFIIPPHLRNEPGARAERRAAREKKA